LLADVLSKRTGRLYKLVEEQQVAVGEPYAYCRPMKYEGFFEIGAEVKDGRRPEEVEAALLAEVDALKNEPVGERELQKVKNQELANSFRRLQSNFFLALQLMLYDSDGDWRYLNESSAKLQAVTAADVQAVAKKYFTKENRNVAYYLRKAGAAPEDPELAALPAQMRGMVKQQVAQIQGVEDPAELQEMMVQLQQMAGQVPPAMKPALEYIMQKAQARLEELAAAQPAPGQGGE
jgi:hypothetical protein